jgi:hypothetical protein
MTKAGLKTRGKKIHRFGKSNSTVWQFEGRYRPEKSESGKFMDLCRETPN